MIARRANSAFDQALRQAAMTIDDPATNEPLFELIGHARIVMLGEASHGTSEFYEWRRRISERLIRERAFNFIAVEGDWPDCQRVHEHVAFGKGAPREALAGYRRFPTWMWGNEEVLDLVEWMRGYNAGRASASRKTRPVGFHGLDVYSLHDSMRLVVKYLRQVDPSAAETAKRAYACFDPYGRDPVSYARAIRWVSDSCESQVRAALTHLERLESLYSRINPDHADPREAWFDATMNARVTRNAEAYYRTMLAGEAPSWNVRDRHMMETLELLLERYGENSKAIIWAHNTHIGDYRATDMLHAGYVNIGGLARERFGEENVRLIGFATHHGMVMAAREWGDDPLVMNVPDGMPGSLEDKLHQMESPQLLLPLRSLDRAARETLNATIGHRAIGVVYDPRFERPGQYVPTQLAERYDALIYLDQTHAVRPLGIEADLAEEPEAYPSGL
jgi:erythromycin esterase